MAENEKEKKQVKGAMLIDYARMIKSRKDISWEKYLDDEDFKVINDRILFAGWYPYKTFRNCGRAVFIEIAGRDLNVVRQFGKITMKNLSEGIYSFLTENVDIFGSFQKLSDINRRFIQFTWLEHEKISDKSIRVTVVNAPDEDTLEPFCHQLVGHYDYLIELYGGSNVQVTWEKKLWKGDDSVIFVLVWD